MMTMRVRRFCFVIGLTLSISLGNNKPAFYSSFGELRDHYSGQHCPSAQGENTLSTELKQAQEQLAAKTTGLTTANAPLSNSQAQQQAMLEVMQQAQAETAKASEQFRVVTE